jgi:hypothetical protein
MIEGRQCSLRTRRGRTRPALHPPPRLRHSLQLGPIRLNNGAEVAALGARPAYPLLLIRYNV